MRIKARRADGAFETAQVPVSVDVVTQDQAGVMLDQTVGGFAAGTIICLSRISGGSLSPGEDGCREAHLHGSIQIDGGAVQSDPNPTGCGYGKIVRCTP